MCQRGFDQQFCGRRPLSEMGVFLGLSDRRQLELPANDNQNSLSHQRQGRLERLPRGAAQTRRHQTGRSTRARCAQQHLLEGGADLRTIQLLLSSLLCETLGHLLMCGGHGLHFLRSFAAVLGKVPAMLCRIRRHRSL